MDEPNLNQPNLMACRLTIDEPNLNESNLTAWHAG